jgi:hypothetical protein
VAAARAPGVAKITGIVLATPAGDVIAGAVAISGLRLPRVAAIRIVAGAPPPASAIGAGVPASTGEVRAFPVPVVPAEC